MMILLVEIPWHRDSVAQDPKLNRAGIAACVDLD